MKKKILFITTLVGITMFIGCQRFDFEEARQDAIRQNAEKIFGTIDPNQDWNSSVSGTVTITADASLKSIARVQILTESPFMNPDARVVEEAEVQKGQTVTLNYDVPNSYTRLIAACIDNEGHYQIKGFNIGEEKVSFKSGAATRAAGTRRASSDIDLSNIELKFDNSFLSYNAQRTLNNNNSWKGKGWEKDRLWQSTGSVSSNGWTISNSSIYREATALSEDEAATLTDIFDASLGRYVNGKKPKNNLQVIRESSDVKLYGNHRQSNGKAPLVLRPVQLASTEAYWCSIYYYYYRTEDIPAGTSEADYIKTLPKFKAIDLNYEREAFSAVTGIAVNTADVNFLRLHEYILPFYGNASEFTLEPSTLNTYGYTTDGKLYRIHNYSKDNNVYKDHYITNGGPNDDLKGAYTENVEEQLWQIFENHNDGTFMFYNVGSKKFLWCNNGRPEIKDINETTLQKYTFYITDSSINPTESRTKVYIYSFNQAKCLKSDAGTRLGVGDKNSTNEYREWTFEEYTSSTATAITDFVLPLDLYPSGHIVPPSVTPSAIIPEGYLIGFMIRKDGGEKTGNIDHNKQGCLYGYGELNTEINTYGQFKTAVSTYGMEVNDPRMATFEANGKTYLTFEEGADAQFSDVIVEIGGYDTDVYESDPTSNNENGQSVATRMLYDTTEIPGRTYMLLFEDRATSADYDMNDVVLRCQRLTGSYSDQVILSLVAAGGLDNVVIRGIGGEYVEGYSLNNREVHDIFKKGDATGYDRFINTVPGQQTEQPRPCTYKLPAGMTIPQFLANIYLENQTTGDVITVPKQGKEPLAIIMPFDFHYPNEKEMISDAYKYFLNWAQNATADEDWYNYYEDQDVYPIENISGLK
jgi:hypothetical protein